jgi:hypothetical protein
MKISSFRLNRVFAFTVAMGFAAGVSAVNANAQAAACNFPAFPATTTTAQQDHDQMLCQLGPKASTVPTLPLKENDPNAPPNTFPKSASAPEGDWQNTYGHTITRSDWGLWNNYDDDLNGVLPSGTDGMTLGAPDSWRVWDDPIGDPNAPYSQGAYSPIDLLKMDDGTPVKYPEDWWTKRRPEIVKDLEEEMYGFPADKSQWPGITWSVGPTTTGTNSGVAYIQKTITGTIDTSSYPALRNKPVITCQLWTPSSLQGTKVPVLIVLGSNSSYWQFVANQGWGLCAYNPTSVQADSGSGLTSYLIGLINKGNWRKPNDWGALGAWSWGVSRIVDYFEQANDPNVDATKLGLEGHSRYGKATLLATAMDPRITFSYPSSGGAGGTATKRRHWGEELEGVMSGSSEYHWMAGNMFQYVGPLNGDAPGTVGSGNTHGTYLPRKYENLKVDAYSLFSLIAPRPTFTNSGTHDSWEDNYGQFRSTVLASPVYQFLGMKGVIIAPDLKPQINVAYISGDIGFRYHDGGHVDNLDYPAFVQMMAPYLNDNRPVINPSQSFTLGSGQVNTVGTLKGSDADAGDELVNWQIKGGDGVGIFRINPSTGAISLPDPSLVDTNRTSPYTLVVSVSDSRLWAADTTITINPAAIVNGNIQLATTSSFAKQSDGSFQATVTVHNTGTGTAKNVVITSATLGAGSGTPVPQPLVNIPPGGTVSATLSFPASAGISGSTVVERFTGTYTGGTFAGNIRAVLP